MCVRNSNKEILKHFDDITILNTKEERAINNTKAASRKITDEIINTKIMERRTLATGV